MGRRAWSGRPSRDGEDGFTLVETVVVAVIIGILASIALVTFLVQKEKAFKAQAISSLRNSMVVAETIVGETGTFSDDPADYEAQLVTYQYIASSSPSTSGNEVSIWTDSGGAVVAMASRGGTHCYYFRRTKDPVEDFLHRAVIGPGVDCRADEFTTGAGGGWAA